jgi:prevent-host-death family protein
MSRAARSQASVISALRVRTHFGEVLRSVEREGRSLVIEKRGIPRAVLLSLQEYVRLAAPEPEVLRAIGEGSKRRGTSKLTSGQIDAEIRAVRAKKPKR